MNDKLDHANQPIQDPALRQLDEQLQRAAPMQPPPGLNDRIFHATAHRVAQPAVVGRIGYASRSRFAWAAAAAILLMIVGGLLLRPDPTAIEDHHPQMFAYQQAEQLWADSEYLSPLQDQIHQLERRIHEMSLAMAEPDLTGIDDARYDLAIELLWLESEWPTEQF